MHTEYMCTHTYKHRIYYIHATSIDALFHVDYSFSDTGCF
jgi:hypothetical protein